MAHHTHHTQNPLAWLAIALFALALSAPKMLADDVHIPPQGLHLKKLYEVPSEEVRARDMYPFLDRDFQVAILPLDEFSREVKSADIKLLFRRHGYEITSMESPMVEFRYAGSLREDYPLKFLEKFYIQHYGDDLEIKTLLVRPLQPMPKEYQLITYELPPNALKKSSGTVMMKYTTPQSAQVKQLPFLYKLEAELKVLKSTQNIGVNETLNNSNTKVSKIAFSRINTEYIKPSDLDSSGAKSYIKANTPITKDKIKPRIMVKKGDQIRVVSKEGAITTEVLLIAKQNGTRAEIINAQNPTSGKILKVKVLDEGEAEFL